MKPFSSEITGQLERVRALQSSAGTEPGRTVALRSPTESAETARDWLLRQVNPEAADAALCRSLISTLGVTATPRIEHRFPPNAPAYRITTGCDFAVEDPVNIPAAIAKVEQAMTPATTDQCEGWLVMLQAATARRTDSEATTGVQYALYAAELRRWPADVAKAACETLARGRVGHVGTNWFPTLAELAQLCDQLASPRRVMLARLQHWTPPVERAPTARGIPEPTEEEKVAVRKMAADALTKLRSDTEAASLKPALANTAGRVDEGGLTQAMRDLIARQEQEAH